MPIFLRSLAFWKAISYVVAVVWFYFDPANAVAEAVILGLVQAVLQMFGVNLELRSRGLR